MKSNPLRTLLEWALIASLLLSVWYFIRFFNQSREARGLQPQLQQAMIQLQNNRVLMGNLIVNCDEYAKTHPDMSRLLEVLRAPAAPAATPAAPKPPAR